VRTPEPGRLTELLLDGSKSFVATAADQQSLMAFAFNAMLGTALFGAIAAAREYGQVPSCRRSYRNCRFKRSLVEHSDCSDPTVLARPPRCDC